MTDAEYLLKMAEQSEKEVGHTSEGRAHVERLRGISRGIAKASSWIPVGERLPKPQVVDGEKAWFVPCLFVTPGAPHPVCAGRYVTDKTRWPWRSLQGVEFLAIEVTHWMPLPEPPK